jgi:predicted MFS family arabinose efflux permease
MAVLRHTSFRNLFIGVSTSALGDRIVFVALALYVTQIGSPTDVGLVLAAHAVPLVGFVLIGGVLADRLSRRHVMIASDVVRCLLHALLAALIFTGAVKVWMIVAIEAVYGCAEAFFNPALTGLVPQTVPEEEIQQAKAATGTMETIAEFTGPAIGTALVLGVGAGWAFALDATTFLVSAVFLLRVRPRERGERVQAQPMLADMRAGWRAVRSRAWLLSTLLCFSAALLLSFAPAFTLGPTVADDVYGSAAAFGLYTTALGAGTIAGALIGFRWRPLHPMRMGMALVLMWPVSAATFALGLPLPVVVIVAAAAGMGLALFGIWWDTALAERVPPHLLSRVSAYDWMMSLSLLPLGYLLAGPLGEALGAQAVLSAGAGLATLALASGLLVRETRELRRLERVPA